jgi:hypothetical protein
VHTKTDWTCGSILWLGKGLNKQLKVAPFDPFTRMPLRGVEWYSKKKKGSFQSQMMARSSQLSLVIYLCEIKKSDFEHKGDLFQNKRFL